MASTSRFPRLEGIDLRGGDKIVRSRKTGKVTSTKPYDRKFGYTPGMEELTQIVAGLYKDVQRINKCITLDGATEYVSTKPNWQAHEADITGPNGKLDGIKEVFVTDAAGNLRVINGYGLKKSDYPMRKAYRTMQPSKADRTGEGKRYGDFKKALGNIAKNKDGQPYFGFDLEQIGDGKEFMQLNAGRKVSAKALFQQEIYKTVYDALKDPMREAGLNAQQMLRVYTMGLTASYMRLVVWPLIPNAPKMSKKDLDKMMKQADFKNKSIELCMDLVDDFAGRRETGDPDNPTAIRVNEIVGNAIDSVVDGRKTYFDEGEPEVMPLYEEGEDE